MLFRSFEFDKSFGVAAKAPLSKSLSNSRQYHITIYPGSQVSPLKIFYILKWENKHFNSNRAFIKAKESNILDKGCKLPCSQHLLSTLDKNF